MISPVETTLYGAPGLSSYEAGRQHLTYFGRDQLQDPASILRDTDNVYPLSEVETEAFNATMDGRWTETTGNSPAGVRLLSHGAALQTGDGSVYPKDPADCQDRFSFDPITLRGVVTDGVGGAAGGRLAATLGASAFMESAAHQKLEEIGSIQEANAKLAATAKDVDDAIATGKAHAVAQGPAYENMARAATTLTAFQVLPSTPNSNARLGVLHAGDSGLFYRDPTTRKFRRLTSDQSDAPDPSRPTLRSGVTNSFYGTRQNPAPGQQDGSQDDVYVRELSTGTNVLIAVTDGILGDKPEHTLTAEDIGRIADEALAEQGIDYSHPEAAGIISAKLMQVRKKTYDDGAALTAILDVKDARSDVKAQQAAAEATKHKEKSTPWNRLDKIRPSTLAYAAMAKLQSAGAGYAPKTGRQVYHEHGKIKRGAIRLSVDALVGGPALYGAYRLGSLGVRAIIQHKGWGTFDLLDDVMPGGNSHNNAGPQWHDGSPRVDGPPTTETSDPGGTIDDPKPEQPAHDNPLPRREALKHDTAMGGKHAGPSTMTGWVKDYLHDSMRERGATEAQADAAARNHANIQAGMEAMRRDNESIGKNGWLYAGKTYEVNGVDDVADKFADKWQAVHNPQPETPVDSDPKTTETADEDTTSDRQDKTSGPTAALPPQEKQWFEYMGLGRSMAAISVGTLAVVAAAGFGKQRYDNNRRPTRIVKRTVNGRTVEKITKRHRLTTPNEPSPYIKQS